MIEGEAKAPVRILLLEDSVLDAELIEEHLRYIDPQPEIIRAVGKASFTEALKSARFDLILSDYSLPDFDGMSALALSVQTRPDIPFIFVSGVLGEDAAIAAFRQGATDYVLKQRLMRLPSAVTRALAEAREKQERRRAEQHMELLVRELSHRVKNTMAIVMSIVRRTARSSVSVEQYEEKLISRMQALASSHALLFERNWSETRLGEVVCRAVSPHDPNASRFDLAGTGDIVVSPRVALALGMIFNELVTNTLKYGALSRDGGRVRVSWEQQSGTAENASLVSLLWVESGGPPVTVPDTEGFGTTLIKRSAEYELQGKADISWEPDGLVYRLEFPLSP